MSLDDLYPTPDELRDFYEALAVAEAEQADVEQTARYIEANPHEFGLPGDGDLANDYAGVIELVNAGIDREAARAAGDAAETARRTAGARVRADSAELRLQRGLQRIAAQTYLPGGGVAGTAEAHRQRWQMSQPGRVTGGTNCGPSDEFAYCCNSSHDAWCGSLASTEIAEALQADGAYRRVASLPVPDRYGRVALNGDGQPATWAEQIEAAAGERLTGAAAFETGHSRSELASIQRQATLADPDGGRGPMLPSTSRTAAKVRDAMGLAVGSTGHERGLAALADRAVREAGRMRSSRLPHPDFGGETARERGERLRAARPARTLQPVQDALNGSLPAYELR